MFKVAGPAAEEIVLWQGESLDIRLSAIDQLRQPPGWLKSRLCLYLDGQLVANSDAGEIFHQLGGAALAHGVHQLGVNLNVQSDAVRRDFGFMSSNRGWKVEVLPYPKPGIIVEKSMSASKRD